MTEKEKAAQGLLYDANYDQAILADREQAKEMLYDYNITRPSQKEERETILRKLLKKVGKQCIIEPPFYCDYGYNIETGDNFFANMNLVILDGAKVTFGNNVFIAPNCGFYTAGHPIDAEQRNRGLEYAYPIHVGNDVWFGGHVAVMPGVTIGDNVVIGAGSIVTKDIPSGVVAVGNPCKVVRVITEADKHKYGKE